MALTSEFKNAVSEENLLRIRIMLKDSLIVDKSFTQFNEMSSYAQNQGVDFWMIQENKLEMAKKDEWNKDLMNLELTMLVNSFTKERLKYCQSIINEIYGCSSLQNVQYNNMKHVPQIEHQQNRGDSSDDYDTIRRNAKKIINILKRNETQEGNHNWMYDDIDSIQKSANRIVKSCNNIKRRR